MTRMYKEVSNVDSNPNIHFNTTIKPQFKHFNNPTHWL